MIDDSRRGHDARVHRALSSPVRNRILALLTAGEPADVNRLAHELALHANTVRAHLAVLEDADLVASSPEDRDRPGRPRLVYRATGEAPRMPGAAAEQERGYRFLAQILAGYLTAAVAEPGEAAETAGTAWGRYLVDRPGPFQTLDPAAGVQRIVEMLDELGFAPELDREESDTPRVLLRRCPFLDVAREHQQIVCNIHLGLMRGALDELGVDVRADLQPFVTPDLCVSTLHPSR